MLDFNRPRRIAYFIHRSFLRFFRIQELYNDTKCSSIRETGGNFPEKKSYFFFLTAPKGRICAIYASNCKY